MTHDDAKRRSDQLAAQIKNQSSQNAKSAALNLLAKSRSGDGLPSRGVIAKSVEVPLPHGGHIVAKLYEARFGAERYQAGTREDADRWIAKRETVWREQHQAKAALAEGVRLAHLASRLVSEYGDRTKNIKLSDRQRTALANAAAVLAEMEEAFNGEE